MSENDEAAAGQRYSIKVLGFPAVTTDSGAAIAGLGPGKPLAMLAYLSIRGRARRDELIELLWGGVPEEKARNAFRQALHRLRTALGDELIPQDRENVSLADIGRISVDRDAFLELLAADSPRQAVDLYGGDFLEGFAIGEASFEMWADGERSRLRAQYQSALRNAAQHSLDAGEWREALRFAQLFSRSAPFDDDAATLEASVLVAAGRAPEAVAGLDLFVARIEDQMGLPVPPQVRDLRARIERSVEKARTPTSSAAAARGVPAPPGFVGRDTELLRLMSLASDLRQERGATVLVEGDVGMGKTRLVDEFVTRARSLGPLMVLRGRERAGTSVPYIGIAEALRQALRAPGLAGTSQHLLAEAARILPELRDSFNLPDAGPLDDNAGILRFYEGVAAFVESAAYEQPLCLVIDDAHNASPSSAELLSYLASRLQRSPVLLLLVARSESAGTAFAARFGVTARARGAADAPASAATHLHVAPLASGEAMALARSIARQGGTLDEAELLGIVESAGGNPSRILDATKRALSGDRRATDLIDVRDLLWGRLHACSPSQRRLFFAAALLQRSASLRLLAAAAHLPEAAALDAARALEEAGLVVEEGVGYTIAHDQTTSFVLEASGAAGRALLAGWAADALHAEGSGTSAELAQLYAIAGRARDAFVHARNGAFDAMAMGARSETSRLLGLALTFAPGAAERADIERMLAALNAGQRLIAAPSTDDAIAAPDASSKNESIEPPAAPDPAPVATPAAKESWRDQLQVRPWLAYLAIALIGSAVGIRSFQATRARGGRVLADSIIVAPRGDRSSAQYVTGRVDRGSLTTGRASRVRGPSWIESLGAAWANAIVSPDEGAVALERISREGTELLVISADRRDTIPLVAGGENHVLGWSPDSKSVLVARGRTLPSGAFDSDLYAYPISRGASAIAIDTSATRAVTEAAWSPLGDRVAWVARTGDERQQDVFVGRPDGSDVRNVTSDAREDYHIAWSPDATLLGFTSERSGAANLYAIELATDHLWRLTTDSAHDDHLAFSPDGRYAAFESTRQGDAAVYVMPALGGVPTRVTAPGSATQLIGWRGKPAPYIAALRVVGPSTLHVGDSASWGVLAIDNYGAPVQQTGATVAARVDRAGGAVRSATSAGTDSLARTSVRALRDGVVQVVASLPGWRADTLTVRVGAATATLLDDDFRATLDAQRWVSFGVPAPAVAHHGSEDGLFPNADLEWESGILSRQALQLRDGVFVEASMRAPFGGRPIATGRLHFGLTLVDDPSMLDRSAPRFNEVASIVWNAESNRVVYSVDPESWSDNGSAFASAAQHMFRMAVESGGHVAFYADGVLRWKSTLKLAAGDGAPRARVWLGGRATAEWGSFGGVHAALGAQR